MTNADNQPNSPSKWETDIVNTLNKELEWDDEDMVIQNLDDFEGYDGQDIIKILVREFRIKADQLRRDAVDEYKKKDMNKSYLEVLRTERLEAKKELLDEIEKEFHSISDQYFDEIHVSEWKKFRAKTLGEKKNDQHTR